MKGQFFLLAMIMMISGLLSLNIALTALRPVGHNEIPDTKSLMSEYRNMAYSNISSFQEMADFGNEHGIKSIAAVCMGGNLTVYNGNGGIIKADVRELSSSTETRAWFSSNHTFYPNGQMVLSIFLPDETISMPGNCSQNFISVAGIGENTVLESLYILED